MCTQTIHSEETKIKFFKAHFEKKSWDWFGATNDEDSVKCVSKWIQEHGFWFCH